MCFPNPSFTNSNPSAATVDANGLVTGLAQGTAQIAASLTANGTTRTAAAMITVASTVAGDVGGSVSANHPLPHIAVITAAELRAGGERSLNIQGQALHSHTVTLTPPADAANRRGLPDVPGILSESSLRRKRRALAHGRVQLIASPQRPALASQSQ